MSGCYLNTEQSPESETYCRHCQGEESMGTLGIDRIRSSNTKDQERK